MSFANSNQKKIFFMEQYGNRGRTFAAIDYVMKTSMANRNVRIANPNGGSAELGDGSFLFAEGKLRKVQLNYFPVQCDVEGDCNKALCADADEVVEPSQIEFNVTQCTATKKYGINAEDIRMIDFNNWDFNGVASEIIGSIMPSARKLLATDFITYLYSKAGVHTDGNPTKRVPAAVSTTGAVNFYGGKITIDKEYADAGLEMPYLLGGQEVFYWKKAVELGGQQNTGIQTNKIDTTDVWYDDGLSDVVEGDTANGGHILAIDPQIFKFITYNKNAGLFRTDLATITDIGRLYKTGGGADFMLGVITDPITGIIWDLYINFDKCGTAGNDYSPRWTVQLKLNWDMFVMPPVACNIPEYNGITHWRTCPEVVAACPTGDTPSPAIAATTRSWNPGSVFPFTAYKSVVGGITVEQNTGVAIADRAGLATFMNDVTGGAYSFTVSGSNIQYSGVSNISANFNDGEVSGTFS